MSRPSRDEYYLRMAELVATRGTCIRRSVGCVLVSEKGRVLATGYNGPPSGEPHCNEGFPCDGATGFKSGEGLEKCQAIHAEQNAILLLEDPWKVDTIYVTASPCDTCMKLLLGTSAKRIVCRELYPHAEALARWERAGRAIIVLEAQC
jgi:dCMP deaminase